MKRIVFLLLSVITIASCYGKSKYVAYYNNSIIEREAKDTTFRFQSMVGNCNMNFNQGKLLIQIVSEEFDDNKSRQLKRTNFWKGFNAFATALGAASMCYHSFNNNIRGAASSYAFARASEINFAQLAYRSDTLSQISSSIIFCNTSEEEILVSDNSGNTWYLEPLETIIFNGVDEYTTNVRIQFDLDDKHSVKHYNVHIANHLDHIDYDFEDDEYWYLEYSAFTNSDFSQDSSFDDISETHYYKYDKSCGHREEISLNDYKAKKQEVKQANKKK